MGANVHESTENAENRWWRSGPRYAFRERPARAARHPPPVHIALDDDSLTAPRRQTGDRGMYNNINKICYFIVL